MKQTLMESQWAKEVDIHFSNTLKATWLFPFQEHLPLKKAYLISYKSAARFQDILCMPLQLIHRTRYLPKQTMNVRICDDRLH